MDRITLLTLLGLGPYACNEKPKDGLVDPMKESAIKSIDSKNNSINIQFYNPIVPDPSSWVLYPLILETLEETDKLFKTNS